MIHFSKEFFFRLLVVMGFANVMAFAAAAMLGWQRASVENGVVENTQLILIAVSLVAALLASKWSAQLLRVAMAGWAAISLLMIQREIDFSILGYDSWLYTLRGTPVRLAFWLPLVAILLIWALPYWRQALRSIGALRWNHLWPPLMIGVIMLGSELTEQAIKAGWVTNIYLAVFIEELFELNAYCVVAGAAVAIAARARRPGSPQEIEVRNTLDPAG